MYARYIPPPKARPQANEASETTEVQQLVPSVRPSGSSSIAPYARYIPPPKQDGLAPRPKKIVFDDDHVPPPPLKKRKVESIKAHQTSDNQAKAKNAEEDVAKSQAKAAALAVVDISHLSFGLHDGRESGEKAAKKQRKAEREARKIKLEVEKEEKQAPPIVPQQSDGDRLAGAASDSKPDIKEKKHKRDKPRKSKTEDATKAESQQQQRHRGLLQKFERSLRAADLVGGQTEAVEGVHDGGLPTPSALLPESEAVHGLVPLPQPEPIQLDISPPTYETLSPWLASPLRVSQQERASFESLGINATAAASLALKGYKEAFAVQVATIPLLLPQVDLQGDVAVSAATGSGKTLAYVLPMIQDVSQSIRTRLRALIVVPTRELVRQAQEVCELCADAYAMEGRKRVTIGVSIGSQSFESEQNALMEKLQRYDPAGYQKNLAREAQMDFGEKSDDGDDQSDFLQPCDEPLPFHVIEHQPKVDVLICTPGRLVEHIRKTKGFTLDYMRWLIVDEADKLLGQSFQQWLDVVMPALNHEEVGARHFVGSNKSGVRKVVLSATMTRDVSLLNELKLSKPKLIVLDSGTADEQAAERPKAGEHTLPESLAEAAIRIRDSDLKPLYLLELLNSKHFRSSKAQPTEPGDSSESELSLAGSSDSEASVASRPSSAADVDGLPTLPSALIFTGTNESALRLSRLLAILSPSLKRTIGTLTSATRTSERRKTLQAFAAGKLRLLVASDLVARGMDLPELDHVINYDVPASVSSYVHRVGRTARAGKSGHAWTLLENKQAAWFWRDIGGEGKQASKAVARRGVIERTRLFSKDDHASDHFSKEKVQQYENALAQLGEEASESRRKG
jgi:ATP-dependent RNA helicase DDX51/DBP6